MRLTFRSFRFFRLFQSVGFDLPSRFRPGSRPSPAAASARAVGLVAAAVLFASACEAPSSSSMGGGEGDAEMAAELAALEARLNERFSPGLHSLMSEVQHRHAALWFAAEAENWPLVDYFLYELQELIGDIEEIHPVYDEVPVAEMLAEMTVPAIELMADATEAEDRDALVVAYDQLTAACNACHIASDRDAIVIQRPTSPPLTNLRYLPGR